MINAVIAIELEAYLEHDGQIEAVHDQSQPVDGYALYLRYENERGGRTGAMAVRSPGSLLANTGR
ncbi:hypothetical protein [Aeromonas veronii]|uniref:hypothetical protein n=1 Tax=Aeromonas veronii TaxID=654 RepID=UPI002441053D|nr:hypothetical protein [Aeromonas veronii]